MRLATAVVTALLCACTTPPEPVAPPGPTIQLGEVSQSALESHIRFLSSDALEGRMTGEPGYRIAAEYVEAQFRQIGLAPGVGASYMQDVQYVAALIKDLGSSIRIKRKGHSRTLGWKDDFVAWPDPVKETTKASGKVVFAGYGVEAPELGHNDYENLDVLDKIVVVVNGAPKSFDPYPNAYYSDLYAKQQAAARHGAVGFAVMLNAVQAKKWPWKAVVKNVGVVPRMHWISDAGEASEYVPRLAGRHLLSPEGAKQLFVGAATSYDEVMAAEEAGEAVTPFELPITMQMRRKNTLERTVAPNVVGLLRGSDPQLADEYIVYSAHLDHLGIGAEVDGDSIYNGAYDNAMGVAIMIETARLLAAARPKRSVLFVAVGGEESGLLGSDYFARHAPVGNGRMVANINLDKPLFLFPVADVVAFGAELSSLGPIAKTAAEAAGLALAPDPTPEETVFIRSDQYSFVKQGVPALFLTPGTGSTDPAVDGAALSAEFRKKHYHAPSDDLRNPIHWESVRKFTRVNAGIGLVVGNDTQAPRWNDDSFLGQVFTKRSEQQE